MIDKFNLYFETLKHVKPVQLYYQVFYRIKNRFLNSSYDSFPENVQELKLQEGIFYKNSWLDDREFQFLNLNKSFSEIDWNYSEFGKLWTYNLNYFEFLNQEDITKAQGLSLIEDFISQRDLLKDGLESYPISLRGINWIKFIFSNQIKNTEIDKVLYNDYLRLSDNIEYHLLANHLLENGFSVLYGAYYFKDENLYNKAKAILEKQLKEQVLNDGAHFELSPMYHQIILHRVLDCINLVKNNSWKNRELLHNLNLSAEIMLGWLDKISFKNREIPKLNDSQVGIAPTTNQLIDYGRELGLNKTKVQLSDSGYRKFCFDEFEVVMDVGQIAPIYQPGHSHADSLQFVLNYKNKPIIVDTGISTYEKNERRQLERSTISHNTVTINGENSSGVWGGFRVANRAKVSIFRDHDNGIEAIHDGYRKFGVEHKRSFAKETNSFQVVDFLDGNLKAKRIEGHLHFHPEVKLAIKGNRVLMNSDLELRFSDIKEIKIADYQFAEGFNKLKASKKIIYRFQSKATLNIQPVKQIVQ